MSAVFENNISGFFRHLKNFGCTHSDVTVSDLIDTSLVTYDLSRFGLHRGLVLSLDLVDRVVGSQPRLLRWPNKLRPMRGKQTRLRSK